jgi:hypothetical protein
MEDGFSTEFCLKFTKAGLMRNGRTYPLRMSGQSILETGFGLSVMSRAGAVLFGTPTASMSVRSGEFRKGRLPNPTDAGHGGPNSRDGSGRYSLSGAVHHWPAPTVNGNHNRKGASRNSGDGLETAVLRGEGKLWPTPMASDADKNGKNNALYLAGAVHLAEENPWPTPRTAGMCGGTGNREQLKKKCASIEEARQMGAGNGGQLNPDWVEALMGYPVGWTDIDKEDSELRGQMYLSTWRDGTWEKGIPRVVCKAKNRTKRIKGLGNAVVPQIPAVLWVLIARALWA